MDWAGNPELIEQIKTMALTGLSATRIAVQLGNGITRNMVCGVAFRHKFNFHGGKGGSSNHAPRPRPKRTAMFRPKAQCEIVPQPRREGLLTLAELKFDSCRFISSDVRDPAHRYCGQKQYGGKSWCLEHCMIVYAPPEERSHARTKPR